MGLKTYYLQQEIKKTNCDIKVQFTFSFIKHETKRLAIKNCVLLLVLVLLVIFVTENL